MKAIVTGGSGFIGSYLVAELINEGFQVAAIGRKNIGSLPPVRKKLLQGSNYFNLDLDNPNQIHSKLKEEGFAFLRLQEKIEKKRTVESDNLVGLLLPLTGKKNAAGNMVVNSLRYSLLLKPNELNFKIFDTRGTPQGAISATKDGISNGVKTFIGPIFSDETKEIKQTS